MHWIPRKWPYAALIGRRRARLDRGSLADQKPGRYPTRQNSLLCPALTTHRSRSGRSKRTKCHGDSPGSRFQQRFPVRFTREIASSESAPGNAAYSPIHLYLYSVNLYRCLFICLVHIKNSTRNFASRRVNAPCSSTLTAPLRNWHPRRPTW